MSFTDVTILMDAVSSAVSGLATLIWLPLYPVTGFADLVFFAWEFVCRVISTFTLLSVIGSTGNSCALISKLFCFETKAVDEEEEAASTPKVAFCTAVDSVQIIRERCNAILPSTYKSKRLKSEAIVKPAVNSELSVAVEQEEVMDSEQSMLVKSEQTVVVISEQLVTPVIESSEDNTVALDAKYDYAEDIDAIEDDDEIAEEIIQHSEEIKSP